PSPCEVDATDAGGKYLGKSPNDFVTSIVTEPVVDRFKLIDIANQNREGRTITVRTKDLGVQPGAGVPAVVESGKSIGLREKLRLLHQKLRLGDGSQLAAQKREC